MREAGLWALLAALLFISELQAAVELQEVEYLRTEGQTLTVGCPFNIRSYMRSRKAWQRLQGGGEPLTLVSTKETSGKPSQVQEGRYILRDDPEEAMLHVEMVNLQVQDSGLYQCVIYHPPKSPVILFHPVRLVVTKDPSVTTASNKDPTPKLAEIPTLSTTKALRPLYTSPTVTQPFSKSTAVTSSPDPRGNFTNVTKVSRFPVFSIVAPVACGLLSKILVFSVLFAVTQRSFRP